MISNGTVKTAIDAGSTVATTGADGTHYNADASSLGGNGTPMQYIVTNNRLVAEPAANQVIAQSYRTGVTSTNNDLEYTLQSLTANSFYDVVLNFVEPNQTYSFPKLRQFDVTVQGTSLTVGDPGPLDIAKFTVPFNIFTVVYPNIQADANGRIDVQLNQRSGSLGYPVISSLQARVHQP